MVVSLSSPEGILNSAILSSDSSRLAVGIETLMFPFSIATLAASSSLDSVESAAYSEQGIHVNFRESEIV